ncbi:hypothetical protein [Bacillus sp. LR_5]|uniref:hypothetical protein n=1 Tax=Bacillus sp. LR_5 TaxID=3055784 RepID=UPI00366BDF98
MTETNAKIHVLADETLGGIKREYVEVDRKAEVGDKIITVESCKEFEVGEVFTVTERNRWYDGTGISVYETDIGLYHHEYRVLEPTDIVHIGDRRYELTDRKAEVGEKVMYVDESGESYGIVTEVIAAGTGVVDVAEYAEPSGAVVVGFSHDRYRVLVPVESAEADEPQPADPIDVIASLAQEVAELKRTVSRITDNLGWNEMGPGRIANLRNDVSDIKRDIASLEEQVAQDCAENEETYDHVYEEMKRMKDEIDTLHKDNRTLGEELARLKEPAKSESIIESAPFVLVINEGRGEFDVYQRGKKIENISRLEIEAYSRVSSSIDLEFNDVGDRP